MKERKVLPRTVNRIWEGGWKKGRSDWSPSTFWSKSSTFCSKPPTLLSTGSAKERLCSENNKVFIISQWPSFFKFEKKKSLEKNFRNKK